MVFWSGFTVLWIFPFVFNALAFWHSSCIIHLSCFAAAPGWAPDGGDDWGCCGFTRSTGWHEKPRRAFDGMDIQTMGEMLHPAEGVPTNPDPLWSVWVPGGLPTREPTTEEEEEEEEETWSSRSILE